MNISVTDTLEKLRYFQLAKLVRYKNATVRRQKEQEINDRYNFLYAEYDLGEPPMYSLSTSDGCVLVHDA